MKIGYDLDGVLISDLNFSEEIPLVEFLKLRKELPRALFVPKGKYCIITGRTHTDKPFTLEWVRTNLSSNPPYEIFHDCPDFRRASEYKAKVINENGIEIFVESDEEQVKMLTKKCPTCKIFHFGSFINEAILNL
jgi:hypothetical protein